MELNAADLRRVETALAKIEKETLKAGEMVVRKGSVNVKTDARRRISGHPHLPHYPRSITFDVRRGPDEIVGQIGPDKELQQGPLGNIIELGTPKNNPPMPHLVPSVDEEAPRFEKAIGDLGVELLLDNL